MASFDTDFPADCLEFCPNDQYQDLFVCGTYKLLDQASSSTSESDPSTNANSPQKRIGQCLAFRLVPNTLDEIAFEKTHAFDLPAVLDMKWKWCPGSHDAQLPTLAIADSEGSVTVHEWRESAFSQTDAVRCAPRDTLVLSIDWSNRRAEGPASLVASLSDGRVSILRQTESGNLAVTDTWHAHDYEPWVAAWNYWDTNVIYSGGDDLKLKAWDVRQGFDSPIFVNKRFDAGVTSIQNHPHLEFLLAVGSYNNTVKLFDTRKISTPLTEVDVGGGAWRIKWHPSSARKYDLLVASMHDGFKVVRFSPAAADDAATTPWGGFLGPTAIINRKDDHESMAYGADWAHCAPRADGTTIVGGCSFYDHKMSVWAA